MFCLFDSWSRMIIENTMAIYDRDAVECSSLNEIHRLVRASDKSNNII